MEKEQYEAQIKALKEEIELLKKKQTYEMKRQKYGLNWIDVPEAFEKDSENKIPILEEVKEKSIKNDDGKPTHILIEGDNYHALQCLNYTHKGKVDVIYIDPPYNTGSDGFRYKDARFLKEFPDGTEIPKNHPLRHSYWLSYMEKRLKLAKQLLSRNGIIFISIDDNEQTNLKLLCDSIFDSNNYVTTIPRLTKSQRAGQEKYMDISHDYVLCYTYADDFENIIDRNYSDKDVREDKNGKYIKGDTKAILAAKAQGYSVGGDYDFEYNGKIYKPVDKDGNRNRWLWTRERMEAAAKLGILVETGSTLRMQLYLDKKFEEKTNILVPKDDKLIFHTSDFMTNNLYTNSKGVADFDNISKELSRKFQNPKPLELIKKLCMFSSNPSSTILDFFAGSGTTLHATMKLNEEDGGNRQCILVQLNENNICEEVTYERNRRVMQGYTNSKGEQIPGLGNSLKYYKTAFIGQNNCKNANDDDRTELAKKAGCLLSLGENTLDEICSTEYYQLFTGSKEATAVYFTDDYEKFDEFKEKVAELAPKYKRTFVYIFAWSSADDFAYEFEDVPNIQIKAIPLPILEIYKSIYN